MLKKLRRRFKPQVSAQTSRTSPLSKSQSESNSHSQKSSSKIASQKTTSQKSKSPSSRNDQRDNILQRKVKFEALESRFLLSADLGIALPDDSLNDNLQQDYFETQLNETLIVEEQQQIRIVEMDIVDGDAVNQDANQDSEPQPANDASSIELIAEADDDTNTQQVDVDQETNVADEEATTPLVPNDVLLHQPREIVFVDAGVQDYQILINDILSSPDVDSTVQDSGVGSTEAVENQVDDINSHDASASEETDQTAKYDDESGLSLDDAGLTSSATDSSEHDSTNRDDVLVVVLDANRDGIDQITEVLSAYQGVAAVHVLSHGSTANLRLGNSTLNNSKLSQYAERLKSWGQSLTPDGDILLYGCDVAKDNLGIQFVHDLSKITGADIAASNDATGSTALGGDWQLELTTGVIETALLIDSLSDYEHLLTLAGGTAGNDNIVLTDTSLTGTTPPPPPIAFPLTEDLDIDALAGNDNIDVNGIPDTSTYSVEIDGGADNDILDLATIDAPQTYTFNADGSITVSDGSNTLTARNIETIESGADTNNFVFSGGAVFNGTINGNGTDSLNFSSIVTPLSYTFNSNGSVTISDGTNTLIAFGIETIDGGSGANVFDFGPGAVFTGTINGNGNDTFDFTPANGVYNGQLTFSGNSITNADLSLDITYNNIETIDVNLDQVNISNAASTLTGGLSDLVDWASSLQNEDTISRTLSGLGANVGVNLGNSLGIAEAFDQLRLEIKELINSKASGDPILAQEIQDLLTNFSQTGIQYADRAIIGDVFNASASISDGESFNFGFAFDGDAPIEITVVRELSTTKTFLDNINDAINVNNDLQGKLRAIEVTQEDGGVTKSRIAFQVISPDIDTFALTAFTNTVGEDKLGFADSSPITDLKKIIQDLGTLAVDATPGALPPVPVTAQLSFVGGVPELVFTFDYEAKRSSKFNIDLGKEAEDLGLSFDASATIGVTTTLTTTGLGLGLDLNAGDFFFNLDQLTLDAQTDASTIDASARIGFLAATANGTAQLQAKVNTSTNTYDHGDPATVALPTVSIVQADSNFVLDLSITIDEGNIDGLETFNEAGNELTLQKLSGGDPFEGRDLDIDDTNFDNLGKFSEFNAASFVSQIGTIRDWFGSVSESEIFNQIDIPFVTPTLDVIFDMADTVGDNLLYDDGGDGKDDDATLVVDLREALKDANLDSKLRVQGDGEKITLIAIDSTITDIDIDAIAQLGFTGSEVFDTDNRTLTATDNATADTGDISFNIKINNEAIGTTVTLSSDATTNNTAIGNDTAKLVDENNEATFKTTQELADKLSDLLTVDINGFVITPKYDTTTKILTFDLSFTPVDYQLDVPVDFNFDLSPIGNIGTTGSPGISLGAGIDISLTLGLDLKDKPAGGGEDLQATTNLVDLDGVDSIDDAIRPEYSISADQLPATALSNPDLVNISFQDSGAEMTGNPKLEFRDSGQDAEGNDVGPDTIERLDGVDWANDGFRLGQKISITGTSNNNGSYVIAEITGAILTLSDTDKLTTETKSGVKVSGSAATLTESPELSFSIDGEITRSAGSWSDDGFEIGDYIVVDGAGINNGVYQIESFPDNDDDDSTDFTVRLTGVSFEEQSNVKNVTITIPDRIVLNSGGNWDNDEFKAGQILSVSGTQLNNRSFLIAGVSNDGLTLFLSPDAKVAVEDLNNDQGTKDAPDLKIIGGPIIRLSEDAVFTLDDGVNAIEVTVLAQPKAEGVDELSFVTATSDNKNLFDLVNDINSALQSAFEDAELVNKYKAEISNGKILITDISDSSTEFTLTTDINNTAHTEIGFFDNQDPDTDPDTITQTANSDDLLITLSDRSQYRIILNGAETIQDVISRIQGQTENKVIAEIDPDTNAGLRLMQVPTLTGNPRLTFNAGPNENIVREDGKSWSDDHFEAGQLIRIAGANDDNNGYYTVSSVVDSILYLTDGDGPVVDQKSVKDVRITLSSSTTDADEIFRVEAINGSKAATKLGILKADIATDVDNNGKVDFNDGDGIINGDAIAGASILDRIFIQDPTVTGNVFIETPDGIEVVGDFGFVSVALNGDGSFNTNLTLGLDDPTPTVDGITINELIKSLSHIGSIVATPTIGGDKVSGALEFNGNTISIGSNNDATWEGFLEDEYISVIGSGDYDGHYKITAVSNNNNTLTLDVASDYFTPDTINNATVLNEIGSFSLNVDVVPDFGLINEEDATKVIVALFDFGNPFADTGFKQTEFTVGDDEKSFTLSGDWSDRIKKGADVVAELDPISFSNVEYISENSFSVVDDQRNIFELGAKVTITLGTTQVTSKIKTINYFDPDPDDQDPGLSTFILEDAVLTDPIDSVSIVSKHAKTKVLEVNPVYEKIINNEGVEEEVVKETEIIVVDAILTNDVTSLTVDTPRSLDYLMKLPDLTDLVKFDEIGISQIIDGLVELSGFLGQFEAFGFLNEPIPLINVSVNDVLAFADKFDAAVQEAQNNPSGTLQKLEAALKEALGIPSGIDSDALAFYQPASSDIGVLVGEEEIEVSTVNDQNEIVSNFENDVVFLLSHNHGPAQIIKVSHTNPDDSQITTIVQLQTNIQQALDNAFGDNTIIAEIEEVGSELTGIVTLRSSENKSLAIRNPIDFSIDQITDGEGILQDVFRMDFGLGIGFSEGLDVSFDLGGDNGILSGAAGLEASGAIDFNLGLGIDLTDPTNVYMFDSDVTGQLEAIGDDLAFRAGIGPLGVFVNEGSIRLGGDVGDDNGSKLFTFGLDFDPTSSEEAYKLISDIDLDTDFIAQMAGSVEAELPVYFPTETLHKGAVKFSANLELDGTDLNTEIVTPYAVDTNGNEIPMGDLFTFDLNELSLMDNMLLAVDGIDAFLEGLQDILDGEVFGVPLPLVGDKLADGARFIEDLREDFIDPFRDEIENLAVQDENIVSELLFDLLGPAGIGLLLDTNNDNIITIEDITLDTNINDTDPVPALEDNYMQWSMELGQVLELGTGIGLDLGIPGLALETQGDVNLELGWNLLFGFGISFDEAFYLLIENEEQRPELEVGLEVTLPDFGLTGQLAFLQLDAAGITLTRNDDGSLEKDELNGDIESHFSAKFGVDVYNKKVEGDERLAFSELGSIGLDAGVAAEAIVGLNFELKLNSDLAPGVAGVFPKVVTDFVLDWGIGEINEVSGERELKMFSEFGNDSALNLVKEGLELVEFQDVSLDLGSFISDFIDPILGTVREVTEPLQPIIDFLTTPLPVISDIGPDLTILDIAEATGKVDTGFIESLADLITFINAIPLEANTLLLPFGNFTIYDREENPELDITSPTGDVKNNVETPTVAAPTVPNDGTKTSGFVNKLKSAGDFDFPIINDPSQIFNLLLGKDAVLMTYDLKPLVAEFSYKQSFPVYPPLFVAIKGELGVIADFAFGFDTAGITQFADSGFRNPLLIFNGFYVSDTDIPTGEFGTDVPELTVSGFLGVAAELNLGIASAGAGGGVGLDIFFDLFDPNHDGKVRVPEMVNSIVNEFRYGNPVFAPMALFDVSGDVYAQLFAYIEFLFFSIEFDITPPITILEFDIPFTRVPTLAEDIGDGVLQLNMGDFAAQRLNNDTTDGDENFTVRIIDEDSVEVSSTLGNTLFSQTYDGVSKVLALAGEGNDTIRITGANNSRIAFELEGGVGNDRIIIGSNATGSAVIRGGVGDDVIEGGGGNDQIYGGAGLDNIKGGGGNDVIFGDEGEIAYLEDADGNETDVIDFTRARIKVTDGDDVIDGGTGNDQIFGGGGEDTIDGGDNDDLIIGDGAILRNVLNISARNDVAGYVLTGDAALEFIIDGKSYLITVLADTTNGTNEGTAVNSTIGDLVQDINDQLLEDGIADFITVSNDEDNLQFTAAAGVLEMRVKGANDVAVEELGLTSFFKKVAVLDDTNRGQGAADTLRGNIGDDVIYGGRGDDTIYGNDNDDRLFGDDGFDLIYGNAGDDRLFGGDDNDELSGGAGNDSIKGEAGHDRIWGDWMVGETEEGTAGNDEIWGGTGSDTIFGGDANDSLFGDSDPDVIFGEGGNDRIDGGHGADKLFGGDNEDEITSSLGDDFIDGGHGGDDVIIKTMGGVMSSLVTVFDSGAPVGDGIDTLIVEGTEEVDRFLLRAARAVNLDGTPNSDVTLNDVNVTLADVEGALVDMGVNKTLQLQFTDPVTGDPLDPPTRAFISKLNNDDNVERINYYDNMESIIVNTRGEADQVVSDNTNAEVTVNGGDGDDLFQVGQIFNSPRDTDAGIDQYDVFETAQTTKGFLSNGINAPMTINGEDGNDSFVVFRNLKVLTLNGGDGDDEFLVKAFALEGSVDDPDRDLTDITGAGGADLIQYAVNAPVGINGGDGLDTVIVLGTEFSDDFVVTEDGVYGAGLNVTFAGIEKLKLDAAEGNDRIFILGTGPDHITEVVAGEGSDAFFLAGDTPPIDSQDLLGHSGIITHTASSADARFDDVGVDGISANVGDDDEPFIRIIKDDGLLRITEDGLLTATYSLVLTREPREQVSIKAIAPRPSPNEVKKGIEYLTVNDEQSAEVIFDNSNWFIPQTIEVKAINERQDPEDPQDLANEGFHIATINHVVVEQKLIGVDDEGNNVYEPVADAPTYHEMAIPSVNVEIIDDDQPGLVIQQTDGNTRVIEGADFSAAAPFADEYTIRLNQQPTSDVTVTLVNEDGQLKFEQTIFVFTSANWNTEQTVRVIANNDGTNEGFHHGYIKHVVSSNQGDEPLAEFDSFGTVSEAFKRSSVILDYEPIVNDATNYPIIVTLTETGQDPKVLEPDEYSIDDKQLTILDDNGDPLETTGAISVSYSYTKLGFQNVAVQTVGVEIGDNNAPGVMVLQSGGSTNVLESGTLYSGAATAADSLSISSDFGASDFSGLTIVITEGIGAGQVRTILSNTDTVAQIDSAWDVLPDASSQYNIISTIAPVMDSYQVVLTAKPDADVTIKIAPQPTKTSGRPPFVFSADIDNVAVNELGFTESSDPTISLTSGNPAPENGQLGGDLIFNIDLAPDDNNDIPTTVILLQTEMAQYESIDDLITGINVALADAGLEDKIAAIRDENRVVIYKVTEPQREQVFTDTTSLVFTQDNWNIPQTVGVGAINDNVVDGGEKKVFAPIAQTLARIQGPLILNGAGGEGSDAGLGADPFRMPGESNDVGNVVEVPADSEGNVLANQVVLDPEDTDKLGPTYFKTLDTFEPEDVNDETKAKIIIKITSGPGEGQERVVVARNENTYILAEDWDEGNLPTSESRYVFIRTLDRVNEAEQVDVATVYHTDSLADNVGTLTATRLYGLGMGPNIEVDNLTWPGGVTYTDLENLTIHMGPGNDQLDIFGAQNRDDFRTVTIVNTGAGNDRVTVDIEAENDLVTSGTVNQSRTSHIQDLAASFPTEGRGLSGYTLRVMDSVGNVQERTILFNDSNTLYVNEDWVNLPQEGDSYEIYRHAAGLLSVNAQTGNDTVNASASTAPVIVFGGLGNDRLIGGAGNDILIGDLGQIDYLDNDRNIVTRLGSDDIPAPLADNPDDPEDPLVIFRQTDGVFRDPAFIKSIQPYDGGDDELHGGGGDDLLIGGAKADHLYGDDGNDALFGDAGVKIPLGGKAAIYQTIDHFIGGNDYLEGGLGNDYMFGGFGDDVFAGNFIDDIIIGEYGRVTTDADGNVVTVLRLGQGNLDLMASTLFTLYQPGDGIVSSYTIPDVSPLISAPAFAEQPQALEAVPSTQLVTTHHKERVLPSTRKGEVAVKQRDTLWGLADIYLGDAYRWPELWKLNPHITDPNLILPGQKIKLPKEEKSGEVPVDVTPGNGQGNDQSIEKGNDQGNGENKPQSLLENDLAIAAAGFVGLQAQRMPNRNKQRLPGLPDGLFILDEFSNRLQPFYKPDHNGDPMSQVERLDTLGMDVVYMASSAEVDMKMTDENTPVISWETSFVSSPLDN